MSKKITNQMSKNKPVRRTKKAVTAATRVKHPKVGALAKTEAVKPNAQNVGVALRAGLGMLSSLIPNMNGVELAQLDTTMRPISKAIEACHKLVKDRLLAAVKATGKPFNENGSLEAQLPGFRLQAWRNAPKLDAGKVFALAGGKGILPNAIGTPREVEYDLDESKVKALVEEGKISQEELDSCKTSERWILQEPKPVLEVEE